MKIAHITWSLGAGGIETMLVDIANEQVLSENVAIFIINDYIDQNIINKLNKKCNLVYCKKKIGSKNIIPILKLNWELHKFNPDIVHIHLPGIIKLIPFIKCKKVFTIHNTHTGNKEYSKYNALYAISNAVRDFTLKQGYNARTVTNGINIESIKTKTDFEKPTRFRILQIGRLYSPHKGQNILLKAANELINQRGVRNFTIDFIGEGPSLHELQEYVKNNKLQEYVHFLGLRSRDYIYEHLRNYDLYIQPSLSEGFGLTIVEAMLAKVPIVISNLEAPMEVIYQGKLGDSFIAGDCIDLANQIEFHIKKEVKKQQIEDAYLYAKQHYDVKETARKYLEEYIKVF